MGHMVTYLVTKTVQVEVRGDSGDKMGDIIERAEEAFVNPKAAPHQGFIKMPKTLNINVEVKSVP